MNLVKFSFFFAAIALLITISSTSHGWTINSRELVDVQFSADDSLIILVSAPHAVEPGIYHWPRHASAATLLCRIASPTTFSFDRKTIIERVAGAASELRLYSPSSCRLLDRIKFDGDVLDADARGKLVAVALRLPDQTTELRVYPTPSIRAENVAALARAVIGRNVEMGFAPDGRSIVNFDLSDGGAATWRVPSLASVALPAWMAEGETTFVPGSTFVKRYLKDSMSVARWPGGSAVYTVPSPRSVRLRQLSATGRYGALHSAEALDAAGQALDWIDFAAQKRIRLATGSIDNAAIDATGKRVAWVLRSSEHVDQVSVEFAHIHANGSTISSKVGAEARQ